MSQCHRRSLMDRLSLLSVIIWLFSEVALAGNSWHVSASGSASDSNPATKASPLKSVAKAVSLAKPGDTVIVSAGKYACPVMNLPDGQEDLPVTLKSAGDGRVVLENSVKENTWVVLGSFNVIDGIELNARIGPGNLPYGFTIKNKKQIVIRNCRTINCAYGVSIENSRDVTVRNCEMSHSGLFGIILQGSGAGSNGHFDPERMNSHIAIQNCYLHDAGWAVKGTEGYGINAGGAVEDLLIENCQIDNNTGDGILYEDWSMRATARYNVIRGSGIAALWIDNATMSTVENNFLEANNVAIWLSGEESSNRHLSDFIVIRNNIIVHNDWAAIDLSVYGKDIILISSDTRDVSIDNNTIAFNNCAHVVGVQNRPGQAHFGNIRFRNNIFWQNSGGVSIAAGLDPENFVFANNLWSTAYSRDAAGVTGDPAFADPKSHQPEGFKITRGSAAIAAGMHMNENQLDFWNGPRPHLPGAGKYDIGAHQYGTTGKAKIGLDRSSFPFEVPPFKVRFKAGPVKSARR